MAIGYLFLSVLLTDVSNIRFDMVLQKKIFHARQHRHAGKSKITSSKEFQFQRVFSMTQVPGTSVESKVGLREQRQNLVRMCRRRSPD